MRDVQAQRDDAQTRLNAIAEEQQRRQQAAVERHNAELAERNRQIEEWNAHVRRVEGARDSARIANLQGEAESCRAWIEAQGFTIAAAGICKTGDSSFENCPPCPASSSNSGVPATQSGSNATELLSAQDPSADQHQRRSDLVQRGALDEAMQHRTRVVAIDPHKGDWIVESMRSQVLRFGSWVSFSAMAIAKLAGAKDAAQRYRDEFQQQTARAALLGPELQSFDQVHDISGALSVAGYHLVGLVPAIVLIGLFGLRHKIRRARKVD